MLRRIFRRRNLAFLAQIKRRRRWLPNSSIQPMVRLKAYTRGTKTKETNNLPVISNKKMMTTTKLPRLTTLCSPTECLPVAVDTSNKPRMSNSSSTGMAIMAAQKEMDTRQSTTVRTRTRTSSKKMEKVRRKAAGATRASTEGFCTEKVA